MLEWIVVGSREASLHFTSIWRLIVVAGGHRRMPRLILEVEVLATSIVYHLLLHIIKWLHRLIIGAWLLLWLLTSKRWVTWCQWLVAQSVCSSIRMCVLTISAEIKGVSFSAKATAIKIIAIWAAAISNWKILISFVITIWSHFSWNTYCTICIRLVTSTYNFESVIVSSLSGKIAWYRRLRPWRCSHHSLLMLGLIGFKLLIKCLYFWHVMLLHGCHRVCYSYSVSLPSLNWFLCSIVLRGCLSLSTLPGASCKSSPLYLMLSVCCHLVTGLL